VTVVDLGCADHGSSSIGELIDTYQPERIYGFDPWPGLDTRVTSIEGIPTEFSREAAWIEDGETNYVSNGSASRILETGIPVRCFDFSAWLEQHPNVIVKMDIEGAEYEVLGHMIDEGTDRLVSELIVEWHDESGTFRPEGTPCGEALVERLSCPVRDWWM
jgi:FkbM family methyltransferase